MITLFTYFFLHDNFDWGVGPMSLTDDQRISCRHVLSHGLFHPVDGNTNEDSVVKNYFKSLSQSKQVNRLNN